MATELVQEAYKRCVSVGEAPALGAYGQVSASTAVGRFLLTLLLRLSNTLLRPRIVGGGDGKMGLAGRYREGTSPQEAAVVCNGDEPHSASPEAARATVAGDGG